MTSKQHWALAVVTALSIFIGAGITLLITSGEGKDESIQVTPTSSTQGTLAATTTSTLAPTTLATAPTTTAPPVTQGTITPGTTAVVPTVTAATIPTTTTTQPPTTTTSQPLDTTTTMPDRNTDVGIGDDTIRIAVVADRAETLQGLQAWRTYMNRRGGLAGRDIVIDVLDHGGSVEGYASAVASACDEDFALVGGMSVYDGAVEAQGCAAIPDLPVEVNNPGRGASSNTFAAFPGQPGIVAIGPYQWMIENVSGCCSQFVLVPDAEPLRASTLDLVEALEVAGLSTAGTTDVSSSDDLTRYGEIVDEIEANGATLAWSGQGASSTTLLRQAAAGRAPDVTAWYCDASCYDPTLPANGGPDVEGQYVGIQTAPFSDRADIGALRAYLRITARAGGDPSYEGLRAFVAGMLFETATKRVINEHGGNGITRVRLFEALAELTDFTAGGIVGPTNVASGTPSSCFVLLQVTGDDFERVSPTESGVLDCDPENLVEL
ncbi:MAG: ABC transporter substrate-binding protein [Actinobacteria bacterium]|nr:ABC transporter substrate-binding protein [Actinomycetota bacterium]